jgi:hypothetical protein
MYWLLFAAALMCGSCTGRADEDLISPPPTPPLSRLVIGYGVISTSYTHVVAEPNQAGLALGYLRKGAVAEVLERRSIQKDGLTESWVLVEGGLRGWLKEDVIRVYDTMAQARTAAESMIP